MKENLLFPDSMRRAYGNGPGGLRATGRTTSLALKFIAEAIDNPNTPIVVHDHHHSCAADQMLMHTIRHMVTALDLKFFVYKTLDGCAIRCDRLGD